MAALHSRCRHYIFALWFLLSSVANLSANLGCRSKMCCMWLAENTAPKKSLKICHLSTIAQPCRAISSQLRHVSTIGKNLLSSNISSRCPHNMVNFGPLVAEIDLVVWDTPANFNGFHVLAALLHCAPAVGISQTAALNRGRHLYSAGWPSRWALAHILVSIYFSGDNFRISVFGVFSFTNKCWPCGLDC